MRPLSFKEEQERAKIINDTLLTWSQCPLPPEGIDKLVFTFKEAKQPFECFGLNIKVTVWNEGTPEQNASLASVVKSFAENAYLRMQIKGKDWLHLPIKHIPIENYFGTGAMNPHYYSTTCRTMGKEKGIIVKNAKDLKITIICIQRASYDPKKLGGEVMVTVFLIGEKLEKELRK